MKYVVGFFRFWYDFVVGDDWRVAAGLSVAFGMSARLGSVLGQLGEKAAAG